VSCVWVVFRWSASLPVKHRSTPRTSWRSSNGQCICICFGDICLPQQFRSVTPRFSLAPTTAPRISRAASACRSFEQAGSRSNAIQPPRITFGGGYEGRHFSSSIITQQTLNRYVPWESTQLYPSTASEAIVCVCVYFFLSHGFKDNHAI
jgi:hypothetical protein